MSKAQTYKYEADMEQLMHLIAHSMYSDQEAFVRELISNAADAKEKYDLLSLKEGLEPQDHCIYVDVDKDKRSFVIKDTGVGMSHDEIVAHLGTVAKSGTKTFLSKLKEAKEDQKSSLIGQFGIGFYSSFVVADKVTVHSRKAGSPEDQAVLWSSDGIANYSVAYENKSEVGTTVTLHLREDESLDKFLQHWQVRQIIANWSNHLDIPVMMAKQGEDESGYEQVNDANALWAQEPKEISEEAYQNFYQALTHDSGQAMTYDHKHVQTMNVAFTSLMYIPAKAPMDIYFRDYSKKGLKLYVSRVFIMDEAEQFLPSYLRFVKGVIDCGDLPLNVSREMLQSNAKIKSIKSSCTKQVLKMVAKLAKDKADDFKTFWNEFGAVLKEGAAQDFSNRDAILKLLRFNSTQGSMVSLDDYVKNMKEGQDKIYYLIAENEQIAKHSPHVERYRQKGYDVLLLTDRVDPFMMNTLKDYESKQFHSVAQPDDAVKDEKLEKASEEAQKEHQGDIDRIKAVLSEKVSDVKFTARLVSAPSSMVAGSDEMSPHMYRLLKESGQPVPEFKPVLELNPKHTLVKKLLAEQSDKAFEQISLVLFDQALLSEGGQLDDPNVFIERMNELLA
ncbi:molecular chaperone HtpG [Candidatus Comchoanobacter bicostacola]|uniref:Chaperone protein HtpG n=1 Tax=Candidatus Comchoanobacter bicostacola TaxID=2919598 RepID=A0ABY5DKV3_9GAMM|nr:molecular chaperone HtpG [Candidatus Comchoanobacter bicostacola]UTC24446.1 molecular chaperone HtpG [Candidatus Comchoanobacter bicostacola]